MIQIATLQAIICVHVLAEWMGAPLLVPGFDKRLWRSWVTLGDSSVLACLMCALLPLQTLQRQVDLQRASEECRVQKMALENAALRRELAVYRSILEGTLGHTA